MANQTINGTNENYDSASISGLNNGETITINGGSLTINSDVRWNQQAAVFGSITLNAVNKGSLLVDGRDVWEIAFDASTGNVPTQNALGSNGVTGGTSGATGELLRVWATGSLTPSAAGGAMPATGYIKLRTKTGTFQDNEIITLPGGATVTVNSATGGKRSWIHCVGAEAGTITASRLHKVEFQGDWYELGQTDGTDDQTFQYPVADLCPAIQIETAAGSGVYEWYSYAGDRWGTATQFVETDARGKFFGQVISTGVITIARRATNPCGYKPPSGCKVRIPNILVSSSTSANWNANTINGTMATRYDLTVTGQPEVVIKYVSGPWYFNFTGAYSVDVLNLTTLRLTLFVDHVVPSTIEGLVVCMESTTTNLTSVSITRCLNGITLKNSRATLAVSGSSAAIWSINQCNTVTLENCIAESFGNAGSQDKTGMAGFSVNDSFNITIKNCASIGTNFRSSSTKNLTIENFQYADRILGTTLTTAPLAGILIFGGCNTVSIDGFSNFAGLANVHPRQSVINISDLTTTITVKNIGTRSAPYDCGTVNGTISFLAFTNIQNLVCLNCYSINKTSTTTGFSATSNSINVKWGNVGAGYGATNTSQFGNEALVRGIQQQLPTVQTGITGTHFFDGFVSTSVGFLWAVGNEPTANTLDQCAFTLTGDSGFTGTGGIAMANVTDQVTITQPFFSLGHTGFTSVSINGTNTANLTCEFQYDTGTGWNGTWTAVTTANFVALGAINPATGIKFRFRITVNTANANNAFGSIRLVTTSTASAQDNLYPAPGYFVSVTNLVPESRVKISRVDTGAVLAQASAGAGTVVNFEVNYLGAVQIEARKATTAPFYKPWVTQTTVTTTASSVVALQELD